jgi:hypothetical protein
MDVFKSYHNVNFLINRVKPYNPKGRHQTEAESDALKGNVLTLLKERKIDYTMVNGDQEGYDYIVKCIKTLMENIDALN